MSLENLSGTVQQSYYSEALDKLSVLADEMSKQLAELESKVGAVLSGDGPLPQPESKKQTRNPICSLDERLSCLVGQFSIRRDDLGMILRRIQL